MQDLCLEQQHGFVNDFGNQLEVSAHSSFSKGQKSVCDMERLVRLYICLSCFCVRFVSALDVYGHVSSLPHMRYSSGQFCGIHCHQIVLAHELGFAIANAMARQCHGHVRMPSLLHCPVRTSAMHSSSLYRTRCFAQQQAFCFSTKHDC